VADHIANGKAGYGDGRHFRILGHDAYIAGQRATFNLALGKGEIIR
jgi:hypothetical protein